MKTTHSAGQKPKHKFLNLFILASKMSITAKISIIHRLTGVLLFLLLPFLLFILQKSLTSIDIYSLLYSYMSCITAKIFYLLIIFAFVYHATAGIRFLLLDLSCGINIKTAKVTSVIVIILSLLLTFILGILIW